MTNSASNRIKKARPGSGLRILRPAASWSRPAHKVSEKLDVFVLGVLGIGSVIESRYGVSVRRVLRVCLCEIAGDAHLIQICIGGERHQAGLLRLPAKATHAGERAGQDALRDRSTDQSGDDVLGARGSRSAAADWLSRL